MIADPAKDELIKKQISQYAMFEDRGVSLLSQMLAFVPADEERMFLESQVQDEIKHSRLFFNLADELGATEKFFNESLEQLYDFGQQCVSKRDWLMCVACQSVIEELAIASFSVFFQRADERMRKILTEVIGDEKRHLDFGFWQVGKWTRTKEDQAKVLALQKHVLAIFVRALEPAKLRDKTPEEQKDFKKILKNTYALHKQRFSRLKLEVPSIPLKYLASLRAAE